MLWVAIVAWVISAVNIFCGFCAPAELLPRGWACWWADFLHLPMLARDFFAGNLNYFWWSLPPGQYMWPDTPVYLLLVGLFRDGIVALLAHVYLYTILLALAMGGILLQLGWGRTAGPAGAMSPLAPGTRTRVAAVLGIVFAVATCPGLWPLSISAGLLYPSSHAGAVVWGALSFYAALAWLGRPTVLRGLGIFVMLVLGVFSDKIFLPLAALPIFVLLVARTQGWTYRLLVCVMAAVAVLCGLALAKWGIPLVWAYDLHTVDSIRAFGGGQRANIFVDFATPAGIILILSQVVCVGWALWRWRMWDSSARVAAVVLLAVAWLPFVFSIGMGLYINEACWRYFPMFLVIPLTVGACALVKRNWWLALFGVLAGVALVGVFVGWRPQRWEKIVYPTMVETLDNARERLGLRAGLVGNRFAKPVSYFSRKGLICNWLWENGQIGSFTSNLTWWGFPFMQRPEGPLSYNFILLSDMDAAKMETVFGAPAQRVSLPVEDGTPLLLWVYDHDIGGGLERSETLWVQIVGKLRANRYMLEASEAERLERTYREFFPQGIERLNKKEKEGRK